MKIINFVFGLCYLIIVTADMEGNDARRGTQARIIGGSNADKNEYPWFVRLGGGGCGGSLITPEFVLTAAHCLNDKVFWKAHIGKYCNRRNNCGQYQEKIPVKNKYYIHPNYHKPSPMSNDLMLLRLAYRSSIVPVDIDFGLVSDNYVEGQSNLWTAGFGFTEPKAKGHSTPDILQHLQLKYVSDDVCNVIYQEDDWIINESMICAVEVNNESNKQACYGDSGGPLFDRNSNKLVGVTSWGDEDCTSQVVVYSRIANQIDWIISTVCSKHSLPKPSFCYLSTETPSTSSHPSISKTPSVSPSSLLSHEPSVSFIPTISPSISEAPTNLVPSQSTYFQIIAVASTETQYCIEAGYPITLQECVGNKKQLWSADSNGQIRSLYDTDKCLIKIRRNRETNENLRLLTCENEHDSLSGVFVFNGFQNSMLWIVSNVDWQRYGMKAVSVKDIDSDALVTIEWHNYGDFSNGFSQQWTIEYPQLPVGTLS